MSPVIAASLFAAGICAGWLMYLYEERPLLARVRVSRQVDKELTELAETETFLSVMTDDTRDDLRLKQYKPIKIRNRAPLAITARPSNTVHAMASIATYMRDHGHGSTTTKRTHRN